MKKIIFFILPMVFLISGCEATEVCGFMLEYTTTTQGQCDLFNMMMGSMAGTGA